MPKAPPALFVLAATEVLEDSFEMARNKNAMSRVKNNKKKAKVDRRVQSNNTVVKTNHPIR